MAWLWLSVALALPKCYTEAEVKAKICWAVCRKDGADTGTYAPKTGNCVCGFEKDFKEYTEPTLTIRRGLTEELSSGLTWHP